jgi:hypothetical protein
MYSDHNLKEIVLIAALVVGLLSCSLPQKLVSLNEQDSQGALVSPTAADVTAIASPTLTNA